MEERHEHDIPTSSISSSWVTTRSLNPMDAQIYSLSLPLLIVILRQLKKPHRIADRVSRWNTHLINDSNGFT